MRDVGPPVDTLLGQYRGARVYFNPLWGNNGDALITLGSRVALANADLDLVPTESNADLIVVNGGGGLADVYPERAPLLVSYALRHAHKPLVILPQTVALAQPRALVEPLGQRAAPTTLYARDRSTLTALYAAGPAATLQLGLDHDMAFQLADTAWLARLKQRSSRRHCLIVERVDPEGTTGLRRPKRVPDVVRDHVPAWLLARLKRSLVAGRHRARAAHTPFVEHVRQRVLPSELAGLPVRAGDISMQETCAFDEFVELITHAAAVATNRLHVAILSALLDKPTFLWGGKTPKIPAVYEYSLRRYPHVSLLDG